MRRSLVGWIDNIMVMSMVIGRMNIDALSGIQSRDFSVFSAEGFLLLILNGNGNRRSLLAPLIPKPTTGHLQQFLPALTPATHSLVIL
jgi:hypothetical protein